MCVNLSIASERHHQLCKQCNMLSVSYLLLNEDICVWSYRYVSMGNPFGSEFEPLDLLFSSYVLVSFHSPHIRTKLCCDPKLSTGDDVSVSGFLCCPCVQTWTHGQFSAKSQCVHFVYMLHGIKHPKTLEG